MAAAANETAPLLGTSTPPKVSPAQVSKDVYLLAPERVGLGQSGDPKVILIFGWMDAKLRSLLTYMNKYNSLYPGATQVLVLSKQSAAWTSKKKNLDALQPAVDVLRSNGFFGPSPPDVLVHVFSNGGGQQLILLSELLRQVPSDTGSNPTIPADCFVFDSVPGDAALGTALRAFTAPIKFLPFKVIAAIPLTILWCIIMGFAVLTRQPNPINALRDDLNNPKILPWTSDKTPRAYIYSKDDQIVPSSAVEDHIAIAKWHKGFPVTVEVFNGSGHVAHAKMDPERYWTIVRNLWAQALKVKETASAKAVST